MKPSPLRAPGQCFTSVRVSGLVHSLLLAALVLSVSPAGGQVIPIDWADETLRVQEVVLGGNAALAAARAGTEAARARAVGAGLPVPAVLSGAMEDVRDGYDVTGATFRLEVGREFLTGGRSAAARALAAADVAVAEARLSALDRRLRADVLRELTRVATARGIVRRLAAEDTMLSGAEVSVRDRFSVGEARYVDVLRLRTERLRIQTDRAAVMAEERAALAALAGLSAAEHREEIMRLADMFAVAHGTDPTPRLPPTPAVDSLLLLAGPVVMASTAVERARASRASILSGQRMRFAASIGAQRFVEADGSSVFGPVLGGSITLPFTAGRANRAERMATDWQLDAAEAARDAVLNRVRGELAGAAAHYEAAQERLAVYDEALLGAAREERESALAAYRTGELSLVELLDFERALARAEIDRLRAHADAVEAYANLISSAVEAGGELE